MDWRHAAVGARTRVRSSFWASAHASIAAALAWFVAHRLLGHAQPFFAPIAAAIAVSTARFGRSRRALQMVGGVLLGIGIAEPLSAVAGTSTIALGGIVVLTMLVALAVGGGFVGEGMMFVNQAAASAILVVTLHRAGTGAERAIDALVGGGAALLVGVIIFPGAPLLRLWTAERGVLDSLAAALEHVSKLLQRNESPERDWTLAAGYAIHASLGQLAEARGRARATVRVAPRRWHLRPLVDAEDRRIARFDLLANAVLSLVRGTVGALEDREPVPAWLKHQIATVAGGLRELAQTRQPWPPQVIADVAGIAHRAIEEIPISHVDRVPMVSALLRATARDLAAVIDHESIDAPLARDG